MRGILIVNSNPVIVKRTTRFSCSNARTYLSLGRRNCRIILVGSGPTAVVASARVTSGICVRPLGLRCITEVVHRREPSTVLPSLNNRANLGLYIRLTGGNILGRYSIRVLNAHFRTVRETRSERLFGRLYRGLNRPILPSSVYSGLRSNLGVTSRVNCPIILHPTFALNNANNNFTSSRRRYHLVLGGTLTLSPIRRILIRGDVGNCGRVRCRMVHSTGSATVAVYGVRGVSPINVRANSSVIIYPSRALAGGRCRVLHSSTLHVVHRLRVRNNYGIRFTLSPRSFRCCLVRMGPHISHSSTLTSGTSNCPVTEMSTGVTINVRLSRVPVTGAPTSFRPALSCIMAGVTHFPFSGFTSTGGDLGARVGTANRIVTVNEAVRRDLLGTIHSLRVNIYRLCVGGFSSCDITRLLSCVGVNASSELCTVTRLVELGISPVLVCGTAGVSVLFVRGFGGVIRFRGALGTGIGSIRALGSTGGVNISSGCVKVY